MDLLAAEQVMKRFFHEGTQSVSWGALKEAVETLSTPAYTELGLGLLLELLFYEGEVPPPAWPPHAMPPLEMLKLLALQGLGEALVQDPTLRGKLEAALLHLLDRADSPQLQAHARLLLEG